ncbi:nitrate ABC transporter permease [Pelomonas sp. Root1217]|uniref:nitrate ABC transporter permease n=1 Tax=Pelomonas sp. Root1217 TaxID=1736430 RepID=UPI00070E51CA|nr:nitrate ABC transporter permease [Pelomonas sp. Root1217]KQV60823.1 nitrate ABC transporter permease [Pelomonas sp. Root1217]
MVSAVFHSPGDSAAPTTAPVSVSRPTTPATEAPKVTKPKRDAFDWRALMMRVLPPVLGMGVLIGLWGIATMKGGAFPTPAATFDAAVKLFADPFYSNGPNDQGIGWNILNSLGRVGMGFGLAALVGIPLGFIIGRFEFANRMVSPLIALLKPVSPLAWLPIGLLVFKSANPAAIWTIFICSIWPMVVNTAVGVQRVPTDYLNVARVLRLSEWKVITRILLPAVLPYVLTGVRLSVGTAWLVIVAAEMLTGGVGIGFWVWDEWNNLNVAHIIIAIFVIGTVGLLLEWFLMSLAKHFTFED